MFGVAPSPVVSLIALQFITWQEHIIPGEQRINRNRMAESTVTPSKQLRGLG